ncbi:MAG: helix-turn-helix domain-containing protein [Oscillospiraceae bacterium]|nr:helix-turn-helix domain-containing protein [Oscillospiraceae bacterium]
MLLYEPERFGADHYLEYAVQRDFVFPLHLHRSFECVLVTEGELLLLADGRELRLRAGEAAFFLSDRPHGFGGGRFRMVTVIFSPDWVQPLTAAAAGRRPVTPVFRPDQAPVPLGERELTLLRGMAERPLSLQEQLTVSGVLELLSAAFLSQTQLIPDPYAGDGRLLDRLLVQVSAGFTDPEFSLRTVAKTLGYDYCYLSRYAARALQMPFIRYLTQCRVAYAAELLRKEGCPVTEAAARSGFSSIRACSDAFKRVLGCPPGVLKRKEQTDAPSAESSAQICTLQEEPL